MIRAFISIDFPEEVLREIARAQGEIAGKKLVKGKLTEHENLHLTLKFLGEISEEKVEEVRKKLGEIKMKKFNSYLGNLGVFTPSMIKILWIHVIGKEILELQNLIDEKMQELGFPREKRFMSHLTVARVKAVKDKTLFLQELSGIKVQNLKFKIDKFKLMKSELGKEGPKYSVIQEVKLI